MKKVVLFLAIIFLVVSCSQKINYDSLSGTKVLTELDAKLYSDFNKPVKQLIAEYGQPEKIDTNTVTNRHTDYKDNVYLLHYDDLEIELYHALEIDKFLIQSVIIKSDEYLEFSNLSFGMTKRDCTFLESHKIDEENFTDHSEVNYAVENELGVNSMFTFYFRDDGLYQLKYIAPID